MVKFKDFSRPLSVFQVFFKANSIFKDFSRQFCIFKDFSSLCEPCYSTPIFIDGAGKIAYTQKILKIPAIPIYKKKHTVTEC